MVKDATLTHPPQKAFGFEFPLVYSIRVIGLLEKSWSKRLSGLSELCFDSLIYPEIDTILLCHRSILLPY